MKLAIVIPWFGRDLKGGAEQLAWGLAWRLAKRGHSLEVLTTCSRSHQDDWATNQLPAGLTKEPEGFSTRRFPVVERDRPAFDLVCETLHRREPNSLKPGVAGATKEESSIFVDELIKSPALLDYLEEHKRGYDWFILLPYLYGPVIKGVEIVGERAALQPCLHDEVYAYLPEVAAAFRQAGLLLFNSEGEQELASRLFGPGTLNRAVLVGSGVEAEAARVAPSHRNGADPYVLYLGRKDTGKNVPMLVRAFQRFRATRPNSKLRLLLAGNGAIDLPSELDAVEDLGLVDEELKHQLLGGCAALFQPSQNESFSRVMMEAWREGKPVAAHASCLATAVAVERAGGGWLGNSEEDWAGLFALVDRSSAKELAMLGQRGKAYAEALADWDKVLARYELAFARPASKPPRKQLGGAGTINQFLPNFAYGDAISNYAIWIRNELRELGFESTIYARHSDPRVAHECRAFTPDVLQRGEAAIYHHSIGSEITPLLQQFRGPKCLIYHNITPAKFFTDFRPEFGAVVQKGRDDLRDLAADFPLNFGVSLYNARELAQLGFHEPGVLPIAVSPDNWNTAPDAEVMEQMQDGRTNLLFVGRIAPNKKQDDLIRAFDHYLDLDPEARLVLVGKMEENDLYVTHLQNLILSSNLQDLVVLTGSVGEGQLAAYYRTADLFWSMSEHEGFGVPLIEAMWFDLPILAYRSSGVPETLGEAGLMFTTKDDLVCLAALASLMVKDPGLRQTVIRAQRSKRARHLPTEIRSDLRMLAGKLLGRHRNGQNQWN